MFVLEDLIQGEVFTCMVCEKKCDVTQGSWPQKDFEQNDMMDADWNDRTRDEFVCYDCIE